MEAQSSQIFKASVFGIQIETNESNIHTVGFRTDLQSGNYPMEIVQFTGFRYPHSGALA